MALQHVVNKQLPGGFAYVDKSTAGQFTSRLDAMQAIEFFKVYKRQTFTLMRIGAGSRVGDIGCGTGEDAKKLSELVGVRGTVTGIDVSEAMLSEAKLRYANLHNLAFVLSSADCVDAPTAHFDAVRGIRLCTSQQSSTAGTPVGPKVPASTVLSKEEVY